MIPVETNMKSGNIIYSISEILLQINHEFLKIKLKNQVKDLLNAY